MARLPTLDDLGSRPIPVSRRGVASVRNAGAVADAVGGLGGQVAQIGQGMLDKEDKIAYGAAKAALLKADIDARAALQDDNDFETFGQRYSQTMKTAREQASGMIKSRSDRSLFEADTKVDIARGEGEVASMARGKRNSAMYGTALTSLDTLHDVASGALDEGTRLATVKNAGEVIQGLQDKGVIDAPRAVALRENWSKGYVTQQVRGYVDRDDIEGAEAALKSGKGMIDWQTYESLQGDIMGRVKTRQSISDAYNVVGIRSEEDSGPTVNYADPLRGKGTGVSSDFAAHRKRGSNGVDFTGKVGTPIYPIGAGHVTRVDPKGGGKSGIFVEVAHADGTTSSYSHMNGTQLRVGDEVTPDTKLGGIGMTGHTTGSHVHVVVKKNGQIVDPQGVIGKAQQGPRIHDLNAGYAEIDARAGREGWSIERREAAKGQLDRIVARDEKLLARREDAAQRAAEEKVDALGDKFTDIRQLGDTSGLPPGALTTYRNLAERNAKGHDVESGGDRYFDLLDMSGNPSRQRDFLRLTPDQLRDGVSKEEYSRLRTMQTAMRNEGPGGKNQLQTERIWTAVNRMAPQAGFNLDGVKEKDKPERLRLKQKFYDKTLAAVRARGDSVTDVELEGIVRGLAQQVYAVGADKPAPLYTQTGRVKVGVPQTFHDRVAAARKQRNLAPWSNEQVRNFWLAEGAPNE